MMLFNLPRLHRVTEQPIKHNNTAPSGSFSIIARMMRDVIKIRKDRELTRGSTRVICIIRHATQIRVIEFPRRRIRTLEEE